MKFYELSQIPTKERLMLALEHKDSNTELSTDVKIVINIIEDTHYWFQKHNNFDLISNLKSANCQLPSVFETIYEIHEKNVIKKLPDNERLRIFNESKEGWKELYTEFRRIVNIMEDFKTNEMLVEYYKKSPPEFIHDKAIEIYKKCISFKVKFTKKIMSHLVQNPNTLHVHYYNGRIYCIKEEKIKGFLEEYQEWNLKLCNLWNIIYSLKDKFYSFCAYEDWKWYVNHSAPLKEKADEIQKIHANAISLLKVGKEIVNKYDETITNEYETNAFEMSLYEREKEIAQMHEDDSSSDQEYCYVYTLECDLFVFYVGIAANPIERFEQHFRGAYSNESHLFKSKFIQKYHKEVKQKIIYEGTRKDCKNFERDYISKFSPLGNMTEGGEG